MNIVQYINHQHYAKEINTGKHKITQMYTYVQRWVGFALISTI